MTPKFLLPPLCQPNTTAKLSRSRGDEVVAKTVLIDKETERSSNTGKKLMMTTGMEQNHIRKKLVSKALSIADALYSGYPHFFFFFSLFLILQPSWFCLLYTYAKDTTAKLKRYKGHKTRLRETGRLTLV